MPHLGPLAVSVLLHRPLATRIRDLGRRRRPSSRPRCRHEGTAQALRAADAGEAQDLLRRHVLGREGASGPGSRH